MSKNSLFQTRFSELVESKIEPFQLFYTAELERYSNRDYFLPKYAMQFFFFHQEFISSKGGVRGHNLSENQLANLNTYKEDMKLRVSIGFESASSAVNNFKLRFTSLGQNSEGQNINYNAVYRIANELQSNDLRLLFAIFPYLLQFYETVRRRDQIPHRNYAIRISPRLRTLITCSKIRNLHRSTTGKRNVKSRFEI